MCGICDVTSTCKKWLMRTKTRMKLTDPCVNEANPCVSNCFSQPLLEQAISSQAYSKRPTTSVPHDEPKTKGRRRENMSHLPWRRLWQTFDANADGGISREEPIGKIPCAERCRFFCAAQSQWGALMVCGMDHGWVLFPQTVWQH